MRFVFLALCIFLFSLSGFSQYEGGGTYPGDATCAAGDYKTFLNTGTGKWRKCENGTLSDIGGAAGGGGVPSGMLTFIVSGSCPAGWTEESSLNGKMLFGTLAANADVGTTGGNDNITPSGTNSGGAVTAHAGTTVADHVSHTHTYTDVVNHVHVQNINSGATGGSNGYTKDTSTNGSEATAVSTANPTGGVATGTTAGPSAILTHSVTQPSDHAFTQPTFAGNSFDNRSAFVKVIFCRKD